MKRRQFFKMAGMGLGGAVASLLPTQEAEPVIMGVDVAAPGPDETIKQVSDDLGGYLMPQEDQDKLLKWFAKHAKQTNRQEAAC